MLWTIGNREGIAYSQGGLCPPSEPLRDGDPESRVRDGGGPNGRGGKSRTPAAHAGRFSERAAGSTEESSGLGGVNIENTTVFPSDGRTNGIGTYPVSKSHDGVVAGVQVGKSPGAGRATIALEQEIVPLWAYHAVLSPVPRESPPAYCIPLEDESLSSRGIGELSLRVVHDVLRTLEQFRCNWVERTVRGYEECVQIALKTDSPGSSGVDLYLYDDGEVGVGAGEGVYFNVPDDVPIPEGTNVPSYVASALRAILEGRLSETIYCRGRTSYRWVFCLDVDGHTITLDRTDVPALLRCFWKTRRIRTVCYAAVPASSATTGPGSAT